MADKMKIGFIGIGIMGEHMCRNIMKAGYPMTVFDINKDQVEKMVNEGAAKRETPSEVAQCSDIIITMLPNSSHVEEAILGANGVAEGISQGKIIVDMSTISPEASKRIANEVSKKGAFMVDAPVVKSQAAAISGDLGILVGGPADIYEKILPVLKLMGKNVIHMGGNGAGELMKICHNMLVAEISVAVSEMLSLGLKTGLGYEDMIKAVSYGGGQNFYLDSKQESIKNNDFSPKFPLRHMKKDIDLAMEVCNSAKADIQGIKAAKQMYQIAADMGLENEDFSAVIKAVKKVSS